MIVVIFIVTALVVIGILFHFDLQIQVNDLKERLDRIESEHIKMKILNQANGNVRKVNRPVVKEDNTLTYNGEVYEWVNMNTLESHCYNCALFKNNDKYCIPLCKNPHSTFQGFYRKIKSEI